MSSRGAADLAAGGATGESLRAALSRSVRPSDCLALLAVPAVLVGVYLLPEPRRRALAFAYRDPTLATAYAAHFVHLSPDHLLANLVGYVLLAGMGYLLAVLAGRRRLFGAAVATYLLAFPPLLSALNLAVPRDAVGYGFSGLNMALLGLLPLLLAAYARRHLHPGVDVRHAPGLFLLALAVVALTAVPPTATTAGLAGAACLGAAGYAWSLRSALRRAGGGDAGGSTARRDRGRGDLFVVGLALFLGFPFVGFSAPSGGDGAVPNAYVHLLGLCLAFVVPYVALELGVFGGVRTPAGGDSASRP